MVLKITPKQRVKINALVRRTGSVKDFSHFGLQPLA